MRNWGIVYLGNFVGAIATAVVVALSGILTLGDGEFAVTAQSIAEGKLVLSPDAAFFCGVLCNVLVCLAIWLSYASHRVSGKVLAIVFPVTAVVALGIEHSVASIYLIPIGFFAGLEPDIGGFLSNLVVVSLGNVIGGGVLVSLVYWLVYIRPSTTPE